MVVEYKYRQQALFIVILLSLASLFVSRAGLSICMGLFVLLGCGHKNFFSQVKTWASSPLLLGMSALFFIPLLSGLWSEDGATWASGLRIKLPLLLFPLAFAGSWQLSERQWRTVGFFFLGVVVLGSAWSLGQYLQDPAGHNKAFLRAKTFATPLGNDHIRFSWAVSAAILTALALWPRSARAVRAVLIVAVIFFGTYLHILSARTGLASLYILLGAAALRYLVLYRSPIRSVWILSLAILLPLLAWHYLPSFQNRIRYIRYDLSYLLNGTYLPGSNDGNRFLSIRAGWEVLRENPFGTGSGDFRAAANQWLESHVPGMLPTDRFFPSSEWLAYGGAMGWPGALAFTLVMALPFAVRTRHRFLWTVLNATLAFSFVFDIGLEVQYGVFLYAFTLLWWWKWLRAPIPSTIKAQEFSVVIICKDAAGTIGRTLQSVRGLSNDIVVYDTGSTDGTPELVQRHGVRPHTGSWEGFGKTRGAATRLAKNEWVLTLDADEWLDEGLIQELKHWVPESATTVYRIHLRNYLGDRLIRWGAWGGDYRLRLYNKKYVRWSETPVHEKLDLPSGTRIKTLKSFIHHQTAESFDAYGQKLARYARLTARHYFSQGRKSGWVKRRLSPAFTFFKAYFLRLGFLDGAAGWRLSCLMAGYTRQKYGHLHALHKGSGG